MKLQSKVGCTNWRSNLEAKLDRRILFQDYHLSNDLLEGICFSISRLDPVLAPPKYHFPASILKEKALDTNQVE